MAHTSPSLGASCLARASGNGLRFCSAYVPAAADALAALACTARALKTRKRCHASLLIG